MVRAALGHVLAAFLDLELFEVDRLLVLLGNLLDAGLEDRPLGVPKATQAVILLSKV